MTPGGVSDGYITGSNTWDGYTYIIGKGKSATTVAAPQVALTVDQSGVITGTVLDQSPAQPGTACVSKTSMTTQMEYIHMQQPIAGLYGNETITGVPVSIDAVDPNGNNVHLADLISDGYSGTFSYTWTPTMAGDYKITATFMGDESYGSSFATTYATVVEAPAASPTPTTSAINFDAVTNTIVMTVAAAAIAIIIAIVIAMLLLRKRP